MVAFSDIYRAIGVHHYLMFIILVAVLLLSLLVSGCSSSSPQIPNIFVVNMFYKSYSAVKDAAQANPSLASSIGNIVNSTELEVRVGYFGICILTDHRSSFVCNQNASALAKIVSRDQDPLNLIWVAQTLKDAVIFPYLIIVAIVLALITFCLLLTFPGWHEHYSPEGVIEVRRVPSRAVSQVCLALVFLAGVFNLVSVLWQHTASVASTAIVQNFGNGSVHAGVGTAATVLGWFGFALNVVAMVGVLAMAMSISMVRKMMPSDGQDAAGPIQMTPFGGKMIVEKE